VYSAVKVHHSYDNSTQAASGAVRTRMGDRLETPR